MPERPPPLTVVVPTRDAAGTLEACLASIRQASSVAETIVVDNHSRDGSEAIARAAGARWIVAGPERSRQRNVCLANVRTPYVAFLDADMRGAAGALDEATPLLDAGAGAVILAEDSIGDGFWARVRREERRCYLGDDDIEACRAFRTGLVRDLGGFDETLDAFEDWDLTARVRDAGARVARTRARLLHDEGRLTLLGALAKKAYYGGWEARYRAKHPRRAARQLSPLRRLAPFVRNAPRLLRRPHLALGIVALKGLEFAASRRRASMPGPTRRR